MRLLSVLMASATLAQDGGIKIDAPVTDSVYNDEKIYDQKRLLSAPGAGAVIYGS